MILNKLRLSGAFFERGITDEVVALAIHEFTHDRIANHLSDDFHEECCRLGAKLARMIADGVIQL